MELDPAPQQSCEKKDEAKTNSVPHEEEVKCVKKMKTDTSSTSIVPSSDKPAEKTESYEELLEKEFKLWKEETEDRTEIELVKFDHKEHTLTLSVTQDEETYELLLSYPVPSLPESVFFVSSPSNPSWIYSVNEYIMSSDNVTFKGILNKIASSSWKKSSSILKKSTDSQNDSYVEGSAILYDTVFICNAEDEEDELEAAVFAVKDFSINEPEKAKRLQKVRLHFP
jgi:hypothetical protein